MGRQNQKSIFLYVFIVWYVTEILFNTTLTQIAGISVEQLNGVISYLVLAFMMIQIVFLQKYSLREICLISVITVPIIVSAVLSTNFFALSTWLFIVAAKETEFERIVHTAYRVLIIMIPLVIVFNLFGMIEDYTITRNGMIRYSLGFSHPNQLGLRVFQLVACHCYINRNQLKFINYIYIFAAAVFLYVVPNSQTAYICVLAMLLLLFIYKFLNKYWIAALEFYKNCMVVISVLFNLLSVFWSLIDLNGHPVIKQINTLLSIRFSSCNRVFQIYGISILGQRIYVTSTERNLVGITTRLFLDNAYMALLLRFGVIVYCIFSLAFIALLIYCKRKEQILLLIILVVYALYGVMENGLFLTSHNIFLLMFADVLYEKLSNEKNGRIFSYKSKKKKLY